MKKKKIIEKKKREKIIESFSKLRNLPAKNHQIEKTINPYGDKKKKKKIVDILLSELQ